MGVVEKGDSNSPRDDPLPSYGGLLCGFGGGRDSPNRDVDADGGNRFQILLACGDPNLITFNISHDSTGSDKGWYSNLRNGSIVGRHKQDHKIYVSDAKYSGKYPPKFFYVRVGKIDQKGTPPKKWSEYIQCEFGEGKRSDYFDFDKWQGLTGEFLVQVDTGNPDYIHFNITHDKVGKDARWYSDLTNNTIIPNEKNPKHSTGHKIYVSGASYSHHNFPGQFWLFVAPLKPNPTVKLDSKNALEMIGKLSPWLCADKDESYYLSNVELYVDNAKVLDVTSGGKKYEHLGNNAKEVFLNPSKYPPKGDCKVFMYPRVRGGDLAGVVHNKINVYVSLLKVPGQPELVDIVYRYFWPFQGPTITVIPIARRVGYPHTADWETIVARVPINDCLNPVTFWTSAHGDYEESPSYAVTQAKFDLQNHSESRYFFAAQNVHSIYTWSGESYPEWHGLPLGLDNHRKSDVVLKGGIVRIVFSDLFPETQDKDEDLVKMLYWPHDWGIELGIFQDNNDIPDPDNPKEFDQSTAVSPRDWKSTGA